MTVTLNYDFDILDLHPDQKWGTASLDRLMAQAGFTADPRETRVALFRDPRTAKALAKAPVALRDYFLGSGFGLTSYHSGAADGRYPARDEKARLAIIARLTLNVGDYDLPSPDEYPEAGEVFRLGDFLHHLSLAQPELDATSVAQPAKPNHSTAGSTMPLLLLR